MSEEEWQTPEKLSKGKPKPKRVSKRGSGSSSGGKKPKQKADLDAASLEAQPVKTVVSSDK